MPFTFNCTYMQRRLRIDPTARSIVTVLGPNFPPPPFYAAHLCVRKYCSSRISSPRLRPTPAASPVPTARELVSPFRPLLLLLPLPCQNMAYKRLCTQP